MNLVRRELCDTKSIKGRRRPISVNVDSSLTYIAKILIPNHQKWNPKRLSSLFTLKETPQSWDLSDSFVVNGSKDYDVTPLKAERPMSVSSPFQVHNLRFCYDKVVKQCD